MKCKEFSSVVFVRIDDEWLDVVESALIAAFRPRMNVAIPTVEWKKTDALSLLSNAWKKSGKKMALIL